MNFALGRHVHHDPASRGFSLRHDNGPIKTVFWPTHCPALDQGQVGSCTGNALAQWLNTTRGLKARQHVRHGRFLGEPEALALYRAATALDNVPGTYPPDDTGSTGLAVCKAGVKAGYLMGYLHAFGFDHFLQATQQGPLIVGTDWYDDMFEPDDNGTVHIGGSVAGGHEYLVLGVDMGTQRVQCFNSWGQAWAKRGHFTIGFDDFRKLLADQGDVTIPVSI